MVYVPHFAGFGLCVRHILVVLSATDLTSPYDRFVSHFPSLYVCPLIYSTPSFTSSSRKDMEDRYAIPRVIPLLDPSIGLAIIQAISRMFQSRHSLTVWRTKG
jgi:hypothetical protein